MDKDKNETAIISGFLKEFATIFTLTIIFFSLVAKILFNCFPEAQYMSTIFALEGTGLPYASILQVVCFSFIMAFISRLLFSGILAEKISFIMRYFIFFLAALFITSIFSIVFKWFPANYLQAWIAFFILFIVAAGSAIGISLLIVKLENRKYNRLLEEYKKMNNLKGY
jgi:hypothetical protein